MEEDREVAADRLVARSDEHLGRRADDDPVAVDRRRARAARRAPSRRRDRSSRLAIAALARHAQSVDREPNRTRRAASAATRDSRRSGCSSPRRRGTRARSPRATAARCRIPAETAQPQTLSTLHRRQVVAAHQRSRQVLEHARLQPRRASGPSAMIGRALTGHRCRRSARARAACRSSGPQSGYVCPIVASMRERAHEALRRRRRRTPAGTASARAASAITGSKAQKLREQVEEAILADRRSPTAGRSSSRVPRPTIAASASPLLRRYRLGPAGSALSALMCTSRRTPAAAHAAIELRASSTCARANVSRRRLVQDARRG